MTADDKARTEGLRIARLFANGESSEYLSMERNGVLNLAAEIAAALASAEQAGRDKGLEKAAGIAKEHRQELFEDGLSADLHEMTLVEAFIAGCDQERDCIEQAIRACKAEKETTT